MSSAPILPNERERLDALRSYHILDTLSEQEYDDLTDLASLICETPIALISLVDQNRQWFKSSKGLAASETERAYSFCAHAIIDPEDLLEVESASTDDRFKDNPLVTGDPNIRFYAGVPLVNEDGYALGSLCVIDTVAKKLTAPQKKALRTIARQVMDKMELRRKISLLHGTNKDLSQFRVNLESSNEQLTESEARLRYLLNDAPVAIAVMRGRTLVVESANKKVLEIWGKGSDIIGKPLAEALPELKGQEFLSWLDDVYTTGVPFVGNEVKALLEQNGKIEEVYSNFVYHPIKITADRTDSIMLVATLVTEEVNARHEIERLNNQFNLAVSAARLGIWHIDPLTKALRYNDELKKIFGYKGEGPMTYEQAIGQVTDHYRPIILAEIERSITEGLDYDITYQQKRFDDGRLIWLRSLGRVTNDINGNLQTFSGIVTDVTKAKQDDQRKNDFIAMVSHELKTPLTSLSGFLQVLQMKAKKEEDGHSQNMLEKAKKQINKMTTMINGFLNVSRLESGEIHIDKQRFDMKDLIKEIQEETVSANTTHNIIFDPVLTTWVNGDRDKIGQVITNLISNALKYSPPDTTVQIACVAGDGCSKVSVRDEGMGIADKDIDKLFDRYYRVEGHELKGIAGFGIGLYLCSEIIRRHQGKIWVESTPKVGSKFFFSIPVIVE